MKKVTIIVPTFRGELQLERSLKSIIEQSYKNIEIIVVDDNGIGTLSQLESEKIINKLNDGRIIYIKHKKNMNGSAARNTGLRIASGDYICFHDDDDLMLKDRIKICVNILEKRKEYDGIYVGVLCCDENLIPTKIIKVNKKGNCTNDVLINDMFFGSGSNIFLTKKAVSKIGLFDERFKRHQDLEYMIRFYNYFKTTCTNSIAIIKSKNGVNNIPSYDKLLINEDLYISKFKKKIDLLPNNEKKMFYDNIDNLLIMSKIIHNKISTSNLKMLKKLSFKQKIVVFIKKYKIDKTILFKKLNFMNKKRKYKKMKEFPEYLHKFIIEKGGKI